VSKERRQNLAVTTRRTALWSQKSIFMHVCAETAKVRDSQRIILVVQLPWRAQDDGQI
jgi:hypothetical protein